MKIREVLLSAGERGDVMTRGPVARWSRKVGVGVVAMSMALSGLAVLASPAQAADPPPVPDPTTVTSDALPTWQINGVVYSQAVVGTTVYVTGSFTRARPPGVAAGGAGEVVANNIFAYDLTTGNRVASFAPSLNAQGLVVRASDDGSRIYVGGDFTTVNGVARGHVAAFATATNTLVSNWAPNVGGQVRGLGVTANTVYVGGNFMSANGIARTRLAAFQTSNGAMSAWAPKAEGGYVWALTMSPDKSKVIPGRLVHHAQRHRGIRHGRSGCRDRCHTAVGRPEEDPRGRRERCGHLAEVRRHPGLRHHLRLRRRRELRGHLRPRPEHR